MKYNWQQPDRCDFTRDIKEVQPVISEYALMQGERCLLRYGHRDGIKQYALLQMMITESMKTSESETGPVPLRDAGPSQSRRAE